MPGIRASSTALSAALCAAALAACGDDESGTIPRQEGEQLITELNEVEAALDAGLCDEAQAGAAEFAEGVDQLPDSVDAEVREVLNDASTHLVRLSTNPEQCEEPDTGPTGDTGATTEPPPPAPPPTTTSTTEQTTTEPEDPDEDGDDESPGQPPDNPGQGGEPPGNDKGGNGDSGGGGIGSGDE